MAALRERLDKFLRDTSIEIQEIGNLQFVLRQKLQIEIGKIEKFLRFKDQRGQVGIALKQREMYLGKIMRHRAGSEQAAGHPAIPADREGNGALLILRPVNRGKGMFLAAIDQDPVASGNCYANQRFGP